MYNLILYFISLIILSSCSQGGRGGVSIPSNSYLADSEEKQNNDNPLFTGRVSARKITELIFTQHEDTVSTALTQGTIDSLRPSYRTDYFFDTSGRLESEVTTAFRLDSLNTQSIIPLEGAIYSQKEWTYVNSISWKLNTESEKRFGFLSDYDHGQINFDSRTSYVWDKSQIRRKNSHTTAFIENLGVWSELRDEIVSSYLYSLDGLPLSSEAKSTYRGDLTTIYTYNHDSREKLDSLITSSPHGPETHKYIYSENGSLQTYKSSKFNQGPLEDHQTLNLETHTTSHFYYIFQNILSKYDPRIRVTSYREETNHNGKENSYTKVAFYTIDYCHESNFRTVAIHGPLYEYCLNTNSWPIESEPISSTYSDGQILHTDGKCIHTEGGSPAPENNTNAVLWSKCLGQGSASFTFTKENNIQLREVHTCLTPLGGQSNLAVGVPVVFSNICDSNISYESTEIGQIKIAGTQLCMEPDSTANGSILRLKTCDTLERTQKFTSYPNETKKLRHNGGLCISAPEHKLLNNWGSNIILSKNCDTERSDFVFLPNGLLLNASSGQCVHPDGGSSFPSNNTYLVLFPDCEFKAERMFELHHTGSLRHISSGKCIHPEYGSETPENNSYLVLYDECNLARLQFSITKS